MKRAVFPMMCLALGSMLGAGLTFGYLGGLGEPIRSQLPLPRLAAQETASGSQALPTAALASPTPLPSPSPRPTVPPLPTRTATPSSAPVVSGRLALVDDDLVPAIYERVSPAVVNITTRMTRQRGEEGSQDPRVGTGSGFIIDENGRILTNNHVVRGADRLEVSLVDGTSLAAQLIGSDAHNDVAVIKVNLPTDARYTIATMGDSDRLRPGQIAIAIGNPFRLDRTVTVGVISSVGRMFGGGPRPIRNVIQTDAAINPGNSGGPLLNTLGEVIGINTAIETSGAERSFVGVGYAVPINAARRSLPKMLAGQEITYPWLGISTIPITVALAEELELAIRRGVYLVEVIRNSPAEQAGLRAARSVGRAGPRDAIPKGGDVIIAIDGHPTNRTEDVANYLDLHEVGDRVTLTIMRDARQLTIEATLGPWPKD